MNLFLSHLNLNETKRGKWKHKRKEQNNAIDNLKMFYKARGNVIELFDDYTTIVSMAKHEARHGKKTQNINS